MARLVTHGPFAWMRNPLYFGNFFIWTGFSVIAGLQWFLPIAAAVRAGPLLWKIALMSERSTLLQFAVLAVVLAVSEFAR